MAAPHRARTAERHLRHLLAGAEAVVTGAARGIPGVQAVVYAAGEVRASWGIHRRGDERKRANCVCKSKKNPETAETPQCGLVEEGATADMVHIGLCDLRAVARSSSRAVGPAAKPSTEDKESQP